MTNLINKITKLAMIPILAGGLSGCKDGYNFDYKGKIGDEKILFYGKDNPFKYLEVSKPNGDTIGYTTGDEWIMEVLKLREITVNDRIYGDKSFLEKAQPKFEDYLPKIKEGYDLERDSLMNEDLKKL